MGRRLLVIASSSAGTVFVTVDHLVDALRRHGVDFTLQMSNSPADAYKAVMKASKNTYDAVVSFGGDGTSIAVIKAAIQKGVPVLALPARSSNVIAKNTGIPRDIEQSIEAYAAGAYVIRRVQVASVGKEELVLDLHFGLFSQSVRKTPTRMKRWIGEGAYRVSTLLKASSATKQKYILSIDGRKIEQNAYGCFVVNIGNIDLFGVPVLPRPKPGLIRIFVVYRRSLLVLLQWYIVRRFTGRNLRKALSVWYAKEVTIHQAPKMMISDDQERRVTLPMTIRAETRDVSMIVPLNSSKNLGMLATTLKTAYYRYSDHIWRRITGVPSVKFSHVDTHLFLGGQYGPRAIKSFSSRGITGIISMRTFTPAPIEDNDTLEILHLPTQDMTAPTIQNLKQGIDFIHRHISSDGAVYVHCRLGEGRGPTMAAAYLISTGMKVDDALAHLRYFRPFTRPNKEQVEVLRELANVLQE